MRPLLMLVTAAGLLAATAAYLAAPDTAAPWDQDAQSTATYQSHDAVDPVEGVERACADLVAGLGLDPHDCYLQADGGENGDASDDCVEPHPLVPRHARRSGALPPTDHEDDYAFDVKANDVGQTIQVTVHAAGPVATAATHRFQLVVHEPGCAGVVAVGQDRGFASVATFVPEVEGVHTLQVLPLGPSGEGADADALLAPGATRCNPGCLEAVNTVAGYALTAE